MISLTDGINSQGKKVYFDDKSLVVTLSHRLAAHMGCGAELVERFNSEKSCGLAGGWTQKGA
jgi:hypothetical protein